MAAIISVGCGGFIGAVLRYLLSLLTINSEFPYITLITNIIGCIVIGIVSEISVNALNFDPNLLLFLKTGLCGGFTTFSTFALESHNLLLNDRYLTAISYLFISCLCCLIGVHLGNLLSKLFIK